MQMRDRKISSVIMAAGRGTRMPSSNVNKVCLPLAGKPAITRIIETLHECGIQSHFVVLGHSPQSVLQSVSNAPGTHHFCYQKEPKGTGNAAKIAAALIQDNPSIDDVLVIAGDTFIEKGILQEFVRGYLDSSGDLSFIVKESDNLKTLGHVVYDDSGNIAGIAEAPDIARMKFLLRLKEDTAVKSLTSEECVRISGEYFHDESKTLKVLGNFWKSIKSGSPVTKELLAGSFTENDFLLKVNNRRLRPELLSKIKYANLSVYLFRRESFLFSLEKINSDNAQKEEYITDTVAILAENNRKITLLPVNNSRQVMTYNTPEEIAEIERLLILYSDAVDICPRYNAKYYS